MRVFLDALDQSPIISGTPDRPVVTRREEFLELMKTSSSSPMNDWETVATEINNGMTGNYIAFGTLKEGIARTEEDNTESNETEASDSSWQGVACGEADPALTNMTFEEARDYVESWRKVSPDFAYKSVGVASRLDCVSAPCVLHHKLQTLPRTERGFFHDLR